MILKIKLIITATLLLLLQGFSQTVGYEFISQLGGQGEDEGHFISKDNFGNIFLTGKFSDTATFADTFLVSHGGTDAFLAKFDTSGNNLLWIIAVGGTSGDEGVAVSFDQNNNIYFSGQFHSDTVYVGDTMLYSCGCAQFSFVSKFSEDGNLLWAKSILGSSTIMIKDHKTGFNNDLVVAGIFYFDAYLDNDTIAANGVSDIFVMKYNQYGDIIWYYTFGGIDFDDVYAIDFDNNYNIFIAGSFKDQTYFGVDNTVSAGQKDAFFAKLDYNGIGQWVKSAGSQGDDEILDLLVDNNGNIYVTGYMSDSAVFGDIILYSQGYLDFFIAKYNSSGNIIKANSYGGVFDDFGNSISIDDNNNIYVTGKFILDMNIDSSQLSSNTFSDVFFAKFDSNCNNIWAKQIEGVRNDEGFDIFPLTGNTFYVTGDFRDSAVYDTSRLYSSGLSDIFFCKLSENMVTTLSNYNFDDDILLFPNPATGQINIRMQKYGKPEKIIIYNIYGKKIKEYGLLYGLHNFTINISDLPNGVYIVQLHNNQSIRLSRFIKH